jgi:hypothetical protein
MDEQLKWDPMDFNNLTNISIPASDLWRPDLVLFNKLVSLIFRSHPFYSIAFDYMHICMQ